MKRLAGLVVVLVLVVITATACAEKKLLQVAPSPVPEAVLREQERTALRKKAFELAGVIESFNPTLPLPPSCWEPAVRGRDIESYNNQLANVPVMFIVTDAIVKDDFVTGERKVFPIEVVCMGKVNAGLKQFGPATSAHLRGISQTATESVTEQWIVSGTHYVSVANASRTEGLVEGRSVRLEYVRNDGWYVASVK